MLTESFMTEAIAQIICQNIKLSMLLYAVINTLKKYSN